MTIVKHPDNPLNFEPLNIYFLADESVGVAQSEMVLELGRFNSFTLGVYDYRISFLTRGEDVYEEFSEELQLAVKSNNFVVRLANDANGDTTYLFESIKFSEDRKDFYVNMASLVSRIAEAHVNSIKSRIDALKRFGRGEDADKIKSLMGLRTKIESAIRNATAGSVMKEINLLISEPLLQTNAGKMRFFFVADYLLEQGVPCSKVTFAAKELIDLISMFPSQRAKNGVNIENSHNALSDSSLAEERVSISIEQVPAKWGKKSIKKFGILVTIGEHQLPICFECKDQAMLYFAALIRHKMEQPLYVHEFYNNSKGLHSIYRRDTSIPWLNAIFNHLFGREKGGFRTWINKVQNEKKKGRALHQAKSQIKRIINEQLLVWPSVAQSICIDLAYDLNGDSYYTFGCLPENISICSSLQKVLDRSEFYRL